MKVNKWTFFKRTWHFKTPCLLLSATTHDVLAGTLVLTSLVTLRRNTPWRNRVTASRSPAFTTTVWVINRVHCNTTNGRTNTAPACSTRFTELLQHVLSVSYFTDSCTAICEDFPYFTRA